MPKNIVICCDGTGNEFGHENSNVVKLYQTLICNADQIAYYHPGVGTMGARNALTRIGKWWTRTIGLAFGYGISENVADAYQFLMRNVEPEDRIYVFGFSRGAYTARAVCGMLHSVGLLTSGNEALIPYAIRMIKGRGIDFDILSDFRRTFSRECKVHFIGVWDTVSSVGWIYNAVQFPYTATNPDIGIVRHAVSIDERRAFFRQNLFVDLHSSQDLLQVWFAGVHSDVGGSYPESESQLSKLALRWMICESELAGLVLDPQRKRAMLGGRQPYVRPDPTGPMHNSLYGLWWLAEIWPKVGRIRELEPGNKWRSTIRFNLGRPRKIPKGSSVHKSVEERMKLVGSYRPTNVGQLQFDYQIVDDRCRDQLGNEDLERSAQESLVRR
jgi:uncharacterized protein (DUF2235 family)